VFSSGELYGKNIAPMHLERRTVEKLVGLDLESRCIKSGTIEDFTLGRAFRDLNMTLVRTDRLHQFRAIDYPAELLKHQDPASFHKHEGIDPYFTYYEWFRETDLEFLNAIETP